MLFLKIKNICIYLERYISCLPVLKISEQVSQFANIFTSSLALLAAGRKGWLRQTPIGKHLAQHLSGLEGGHVGGYIFLKRASGLKRLGNISQDCARVVQQKQCKIVCVEFPNSGSHLFSPSSWQGDADADFTQVSRFHTSFSVSYEVQFCLCLSFSLINPALSNCPFWHT